MNKLDLLFMVDNSDSMGNKQAALRAQLPHLITVLTTGDLDGDGKRDQTAVADLHLGVVTSDMGLPGVDGIVNCNGLGQDGILQNHPSSQVQNCQPSYPPFLSFKAGINQPMLTAADFACVSAVGTGGCGFEHQLESPLKALWPSVDPMASANGGNNRIAFLTDPATSRGKLGHGDVENVGFLRNDPIAGLSAIAIVVLSDEDDCSSSDTGPFTPPQFLQANDPLAMQGMLVRCHFNQQALYPVERYINGFKALRPGNENLVIYAAIVGVPGDLVSPDAQAKVDFTNAAQLSAFYDHILSDPRMQEVVDTSGTSDPSDDRLIHSCGGTMTADAPIRLVRVARGFGTNGILQSICEADLGHAVDAIATRVASRLGPPCLPRKIARDNTGLVACDLLWELPPPGQQPSGTPLACASSGFPFLQPRKRGANTSARGGAICEVVQMSVKVDVMTSVVPTTRDGVLFNDGWYYDDFSDQVSKECPAGSAQRIAFTAGASPPMGVRVSLDCGP